MSNIIDKDTMEISPNILRMIELERNELVLYQGKPFLLAERTSLLGLIEDIIALEPSDENDIQIVARGALVDRYAQVCKRITEVILGSK